MFAGTGTPSKPGIYRSTDAGKSWRHLAVEIASECPNVGIPRPTAILGGDLPVLVTEMKALERRRALQAEIESLEHVGRLSASDLQAVEPELLIRLADWRAMFRRHVIEARQILGQVLAGRVTFTPRQTGERHARAKSGGGPKGNCMVVGHDLTFEVRGTAFRP